mmetsp:Transcript_22459/g.33599  ORF Transcript_22459/g.33599 Transcript_22459/m.33599 type:complete len:124 (+) Transcript_22459:104-475(+)
MGGHSAWRKRVKNGELAKQGGGAICRHRPHFGKKIHPNQKKGEILGGPRKKRKRNAEHPQSDQCRDDDRNTESMPAKNDGGASRYWSSTLPAEAAVTGKFLIECAIFGVLFVIIRSFLSWGWS